MYLEEMRHFLACVRGEATPLVTGEDGRRVLDIALAARQSASTGMRIRLDPSRRPTAMSAGLH